jgi:Lar family restriction alleviation protein
VSGNKCDLPLDPCPFCGGMGVVMEHSPTRQNSAHYFFGNCLPCDAEGPPCQTALGAQKGWNARSQSTSGGESC